MSAHQGEWPALPESTYLDRLDPAREPRDQLAYQLHVGEVRPAAPVVERRRFLGLVSGCDHGPLLADYETRLEAAQAEIRSLQVENAGLRQHLHTLEDSRQELRVALENRDRGSFRTPDPAPEVTS